MNELAEYTVQGVSLWEIYHTRRVEVVLTRSRFRHLEEMTTFDHALVDAVIKGWVEFEVVDDYAAGTKTLILYPAGDAPPEFDGGKRVRYLHRAADYQVLESLQRHRSGGHTRWSNYQGRGAPDLPPRNEERRLLVQASARPSMAGGETEK